MITAKDIFEVTRGVTKEWTKQRKAEERSSRAIWARGYIYSDRVNFTDVAGPILHAGYAHASGDGKYTVDKRQFYYAVRDQFLEKTGREIRAGYFSQNLLVKYMNQHPERTAPWKITASPRGTLTIPNAGPNRDVRIPCGTTAIAEYLKAAAKCDPLAGVKDFAVNVTWPSLAEGQRYQAVLYIEKEGFDPQLREARIADRFDVAIISCKGQSVTAARMFVDQVCRVNGGVPLFVAHDFDKYGFEIAQRLTTISDEMLEKDLQKYEFQNAIDVTDLGLRLADVQKYDLKSERHRFRGHFPGDTIATPEDQEFLRSNRRVELNAFTAPQFIEWVENGLRAHGCKERLIPDDRVLDGAFRRAWANAILNQAIAAARKEALKSAKAARVPRSLRRQLKKKLNDQSEAWDRVLYDLVESMVSKKRGG
jgi:hypothetical protein